MDGTVTKQVHSDASSDQKQDAIVAYLRRLCTVAETSPDPLRLDSVASQLAAKPQCPVSLLADEGSAEFARLKNADSRTLRPRCLQLPLSSGNDKSHRCYLIFSTAPDFNALENYLQQSKQNLIQLKALRASHLIADKASSGGEPISLVIQKLSGKALPGGCNDPELWQQVSFHKGAVDLHAGVRRVLQSGESDRIQGSGSVQASVTLQFNPQVLSALVPRFKQQPFGFWMEIERETFFPYESYPLVGSSIPDKKNAIYRIQNGDRMFARCEIEELRYYQFAAGVHSLVVAVTYQQLDVMDKCSRLVGRTAITMEDVRELNNRLVREEKKKPPLLHQPQLIGVPHFKRIPCDVQRSNKQADCLTALNDAGLRLSAEELVDLEGYTVAGLDQEARSLRPWLQALLPGDLRLTDAPRPLIYSQLLAGEDERLAVDLKDNLYLGRLLRQLASRQNHEYMGERFSRHRILGDADIEHLCCREGGVVLINPNLKSQPDRDFQRNFIPSNGQQAYLGILLLAQMQYTYLNALDQGMKIDFSDLKETTMARHRRLQELLVEFRVNNCFADVGILDIHNQCYQAWEAGFALPELLRQLDKNVHETGALLELKYKELALQHDKKIRNIATAGAGMIFLSGVFGTNFAEMTEINQGKPVQFFSQDWHWALIGAVLMVLTFYLTAANRDWGLLRSLSDRRARYFWYLLILSSLLVVIGLELTPLINLQDLLG